MIKEQFDSKSETTGAAKLICAQQKCKIFVYGFPRAIPRRWVVVDAEGAQQYVGKDWAELILTCTPEVAL